MTFHNRLKLFSFAFVFALFTLLQRHHPLDPLAVRSVAHTQVRRESTEPVHTHIHRGIIPQLCHSSHSIHRLAVSQPSRIVQYSYYTVLPTYPIIPSVDPRPIQEYNILYISIHQPRFLIINLYLYSTLYSTV